MTVAAVTPQEQTPAVEAALAVARVVPAKAQVATPAMAKVVLGGSEAKEASVAEEVVGLVVLVVSVAAEEVGQEEKEVSVVEEAVDVVELAAEVVVAVVASEEDPEEDAGEEVDDDLHLS
jgi:hypothetical protein